MDIQLYDEIDVTDIYTLFGKENYTGPEDNDFVP